jgi:hypothetical protein
MREVDILISVSVTTKDLTSSKLQLLSWPKHYGISSFKGRPGNTKGGSITVLLTSCLTGLELSV